MKLWEITIINAFGIDEQTIAVEGNNLLITGGNGTGKTSILDSIDACFFGPKERVIRDPSRPSKFLILTEEYSFERQIEVSDKGAATSKKFEIRRGDVKIKGPQTFVGKIVSALSMRPVVFFDAAPDIRRSMLLRAMPLDLDRTKVLMYALRFDGVVDVDAIIERGDEAKLANSLNTPDELDGPALRIMRELVRLPDIDWDAHGFDVAKRLYDAAYEARHSVGRELESKQNVVSGIRSLVKKPYVPEAHRDADQMVRHLTTKQTELQQANEQTRLQTEESARLAKEIATRADDIEELVRKLTRLRDDQLRAEERNNELRTLVDQTRDRKIAIINEAAVIDPEVGKESLEVRISYWRAIVEQWATAKSTNDEIDRQTAAGVEHVQDEIKALEIKRAIYDTATRFTEKVLPLFLIGELEQEGRLPLKGLSLWGEQILWNGKSIDVMSKGERMHFTMRLVLSLLQPTDADDALKLVCIDDFESLDPDLQAVIDSYEKPGDVQFIKVRVRTADEPAALHITPYDPTAAPAASK